MSRAHKCESGFQRAVDNLWVVTATFSCSVLGRGSGVRTAGLILQLSGNFQCFSSLYVLASPVLLMGCRQVMPAFCDARECFAVVVCAGCPQLGFGALSLRGLGFICACELTGESC